MNVKAGALVSPLAASLLLKAVWRPAFDPWRNAWLLKTHWMLPSLLSYHEWNKLPLSPKTPTSNGLISSPISEIISQNSGSHPPLKGLSIFFPLVLLFSQFFFYLTFCHLRGAFSSPVNLLAPSRRSRHSFLSCLSVSVLTAVTYRWNIKIFPQRKPGLLWAKDMSGEREKEGWRQRWSVSGACKRHHLLSCAGGRFSWGPASLPGQTAPHIKVPGRRFMRSSKVSPLSITANFQDCPPLENDSVVLRPPVSKVLLGSGVCCSSGSGLECVTWGYCGCCSVAFLLCIIANAVWGFVQRSKKTGKKIPLLLQDSPKDALGNRQDN